MTATLRLSCCDETYTTTYDILGDETTPACEDVEPCVIYERFARQIVEVHPFGAATWTEYDRDGIVSGVSQPVRFDTTGWSPCGGGIAREESEQREISFDLSGAFEAIKAGLTFTAGFHYSTTQALTVTFEAAGKPNRNIKLDAYAHPITLNVISRNYRERFCAKDWFNNTVCDPWIVHPNGQPRVTSDPQQGECDPEVILCERCCSL